MTEGEISFFPEDSVPFDVTYGHWTVKWWQWALSTPKAISPIIDQSGEFASVNQPAKDVWFLAGKFGNEDRNLPNRFCRIPAGRSILFPVINCEANPLEYPELRTDEALIEHIRSDEDTIISKDCFVNGKRVPVYRVKSDPLIFEVRIDEDNAANVKGGGTARASADGYWVFLKPLRYGEHTISFHGSCENGRLNSGANYRVKVE